MSLWLTETAEHALVATVINEAHRVAHESGGYIGRTAVQKMIYFLKARGVPMSYKFDIYHYGPYSDALQSDLDWLKADDVIKDVSANPKYSSFAPGATINEALALHRDRIDPYRDVISEVVNAFAPLKPEQLELTATLDYVYRRIRGTGIAIPGRERVVQEFMAIKKDKFPLELVTNTYDSMDAAGVFVS